MIYIFLKQICVYMNYFGVYFFLSIFFYFLLCDVAGVAHRITLRFRVDVIYVYCLLHPEEAVMAKR